VSTQLQPHGAQEAHQEAEAQSASAGIGGGLPKEKTCRFTKDMGEIENAKIMQAEKK
jgi:hypothetical protein